jgi:two-component system sensor histidine kinase HydH
MTVLQSLPMKSGPFRLLKYFIITGFAVIAIVTILLSVFLYTRSVDTLVRWAENYARMLARNLNYNMYHNFYKPLKATGGDIDISKWEQFGALDTLIKDFTYGLNIERIRIIDPKRKVVYSTAYDQIGKFEPKESPFDKALTGTNFTVVSKAPREAKSWRQKWLVSTFYPLSEITGSIWKVGKTYGVIEITQDVTDQYYAVQKSIVVIIGAAVGLMAFVFVALTLIVRRGENILFQQAAEQEGLQQQLQQSEKLASIGQMVATIAHEIRNPLGIIRSSAEVLSRKADSDPSRAKKLSSVIVEEATRLSLILTDFLNFARPKTPKPVPINAIELISRVRNNLTHDMKTKNITWNQTDLDDELPMIVGDSDQLYQAFLNVAMNAFEAMDDGGALMVSAQEMDSQVAITFSDTGHGILEKDLPNIFTPFFTTHEMGTGLGLSVVHNIVTAHNGEILVGSNEDGGAVFTIILPKVNSEMKIGRDKLEVKSL